MKFTGTAHRYGRDVDTDVIIPARYLNTTDPAELGSTAWRTSTRGSSSKVAARRHHRRRRELRLRLEPRARADLDQGRRRLGGHRQELRAHLLPQRHQHRACRSWRRRRRSTASRTATGSRSMRTRASSPTRPRAGPTRRSRSRRSSRTSSRRAGSSSRSRRKDRVIWAHAQAASTRVDVLRGQSGLDSSLTNERSVVACQSRPL